MFVKHPIQGGCYYCLEKGCTEAVHPEDREADLRRFITTTLTHLTQQHEAKIIDKAWKYCVEATRAESWSKEEMIKFIKEGKQ